MRRNPHLKNKMYLRLPVNFQHNRVRQQGLEALGPYRNRVQSCLVRRRQEKPSAFLVQLALTPVDVLRTNTPAQGMTALLGPRITPCSEAVTTSALAPNGKKE